MLAKKSNQRQRHRQRNVVRTVLNHACQAQQHNLSSPPPHTFGSVSLPVSGDVGLDLRPHLPLRAATLSDKTPALQPAQPHASWPCVRLCLLILIICCSPASNRPLCAGVVVFPPKTFWHPWHTPMPHWLQAQSTEGGLSEKQKGLVTSALRLAYPQV